MKKYQKDKVINFFVLTTLIIIGSLLAYLVIYEIAYYTLVPGFVFIFLLIRYFAKNEMQKYKKRNGANFWE
jgi:hypothetical protein